MTTIFFDESGNTGRQLADIDQPIFILGSCDLTSDEAELLLAPLWSRQAAEIHFKKLRKTPRGQDRIIDLLGSELICKERFKVSVFHKRFMLLTKIMDDLLEDLIYDLGGNFYENGLNRALSNMLYHVMPVFCGEQSFSRFLSLYHDMCIHKTEEGIRLFYEHILAMQGVCERAGYDLEAEFGLLLMTQCNVRKVLARIEDSTFNPAIPAFFHLCMEWGRKYASFDAVCDDSEPVERQRDFFEMIADSRNPLAEIGYGPNQFELPLKIRNLTFLPSHESIGVQLADVVTSSLSYYLNRKVSGEVGDEFYLRLNQLDKLESLITQAVWPSLDVTPEALGREGDEQGHNPVDAMADFIIRGRQLPN